MTKHKIQIFLLLPLLITLLLGCTNTAKRYDKCVEECCTDHGCRDNQIQLDENGKYIINKCDSERTYCKEYNQACKNICIKKYK